MSEPKDGVYICGSLPDDDYFGARRLGSSDLVDLYEDPASWWYGSWLNPDRPERKITAEMEFGRALHALVLEGENEYERIVRIRPDAYPDAKTGELKPWHKGAKFCQEWHEANEKPGLLILTAKADRYARHMAALMHNHPQLGKPMQGGLSEVAVLFRSASGIPLRAKFDKLLPRFIVDLKTYRGDMWGNTITAQCLNTVSHMNMDIQRYEYWLARQRMGELIADGHLFGGNDHQREWIAKCAAVEDWNWAWLFYRKRDDEAGYAPLVKPIFRKNPDLTWDTGRQKMDVALQNFVAFRDRFGDVPWAVVEPADDPEDMMFPPRIAEIKEPITFAAEEED